MKIGLSATAFYSLFFGVEKKKATQSHLSKTGLHKQRCHLDLRKFFFSDRVVDRWNNLEQEDIDCGSVNRFKSKLEKLRRKEDGLYRLSPASPMTSPLDPDIFWILVWLHQVINDRPGKCCSVRHVCSRSSERLVSAADATRGR